MSPRSAAFGGGRGEALWRALRLPPAPPVRNALRSQEGAARSPPRAPLLRQPCPCRCAATGFPETLLPRRTRERSPPGLDEGIRTSAGAGGRRAPAGRGLAGRGERGAGQRGAAGRGPLCPARHLPAGLEAAVVVAVVWRGAAVAAAEAGGGSGRQSAAAPQRPQRRRDLAEGPRALGAGPVPAVR